MWIRFLVNSTVNGVSYVPGQEDCFSKHDAEMVISLGGGIEIDAPGSVGSEPKLAESVVKEAPKLWSSKRKK